MISTFFTKFAFLTIALFSFLLIYSNVAGAQAQNELKEICTKTPGSALCQSYNIDNDTKDPLNNPVVKTLLVVNRILFFIVGALAVIYIVWGGFKYVKGGGDSNAVTDAKKTILYAIIGLVLAILAPQVIAFAIGWFFN